MTLVAAGAFAAIGVAASAQPAERQSACATISVRLYFNSGAAAAPAPAMRTLDAATAQAPACSIDRIDVVGHTDASGPEAANMALSVQRAIAIRDALIQRGVEASLIQVEGRGEREPLRAGEDGVREPLNRRVDVTIRFQ